MKNHTKIYMKYFGYDICDYIPSELSGSRAVDLHHIECRGRGGSKEKDTIENIMALTREEHINYGDKSQHKEWLIKKHYEFAEKMGKPFDK